MPRQTITLSEPNYRWVQQRVASGEFATQTEAVNDALRRARELENGVESIRKALIEGEKSGVTDQRLDQIWDEARDCLRRGDG